MAEQLLPDWAMKKAAELAGWGSKNPEVSVTGFGQFGSDIQEAFARYIAAHEEAPVDPVIVEARKAAEDLGWLTGNNLPLLRRGQFDGSQTMVDLVKILRRGIEIGKAQA